MSEVYHLDSSQWVRDVMGYRYSKELRISKALIDVPEQYQRGQIKTEHDVINACADLAANALSGEQRESDIPCWEGHYEQFGMTMLNLLNLSQHRYVPFHDKILPDPQDVDHIFAPGSDSSQRIFYRSWFGLIGHPHFLHHGAFGMELEYHAYTRLCLTIAWDDLTCRVGSRLERSVKPATSRAIFSGHPHAQTPPKHLKQNVAIKGKAMVMNVTVEINPSEQAIMDCEAIYNAFDTLITCDGFVGDNILKPKSQSTLFWDWAIVEVGQFKIPAPIHSCAAGCSILYDHRDRSIELSNPECASVTAIYYLDMLRRMASEWDRLGDRLPITARYSLDPGVDWVKSLPPAQFQEIIFALKSTLSEKGHQVLN